MTGRVPARAALTLALLALAAPAAPAGAASKLPFTCGPEHRWCIGVFDQRKRLVFTVYHFDVRGRYDLCVTPPGAKERCRTFGLRRNQTGAFASTVDFRRNFPHRRHGRYRVRWILGGAQLGRTQSFTA
jgi:hypothetical protein